MKLGTHHAYLFIGDHTFFQNVLVPYLYEQAATPAAVELIDTNTLTISDAHQLKVHASQRSLEGGSFFGLYTEVMTPAAQQALLKLFEEPLPATVFFLVTGSKDRILPTLQSRMSIEQRTALEYTFTTDEQVKKQIRSFLSFSYEQRLSYISKLLQRYDTADSPVALKAAATRFLHMLEFELADSSVSSDVLHRLWELKHFTYDSGSSVKMLLESIALTVPQR